MDNQHNNKGDMFSLDHRLFLVILLLIPFYLFKNPVFKTIGYFSIILLFLVVILYAIRKFGEYRSNEIFMWFIIFLVYSTLMLIRTPTIKGLYSYLLQVALVFFITMFSVVNIDEKTLKDIFKWGKILYLILLIPAGIIALEGGRGAFVRFNMYFSPVIYKIMLPCTFFYIANSKKKPILILFFAFIYFRMVERTSSIVLITIYILYLLIKRIKDSKKTYNLIFICIFIAVILFVYGYIQMENTNLGRTLNDIFNQFTGGNFYSGRNRIWRTVFEFIKERPLIGYGIDNKVLVKSGIKMSTHNTYIHLMLQGGLIGLSIFFMFLYSIWKRYFRFIDNDIVAVAAAYLIGTLIFVNFEVTLIGNTTVTAIYYWFILGIGLVKCNNLDLLNKKTKSNY